MCFILSPTALPEPFIFLAALIVTENILEREREREKVMGQCIVYIR